MKNREIKFRAFIDGAMIDADALAFEEYLPVNQLLSSCENIMEFTGLHDKNAKEIYEGDIVIKTNYGKKVRKDTGVVKYYEQGACFLFYNVCYTNLIADNIELEIIGNVYQHTELLK
jgi:uncharacterized phage protein (TIGR01671 family)